MVIRGRAAGQGSSGSGSGRHWDVVVDFVDELLQLSGDERLGGEFVEWQNVGARLAEALVSGINDRRVNQLCRDGQRPISTDSRLGDGAADAEATKFDGGHGERDRATRKSNCRSWHCMSLFRVNRDLDWSKSDSSHSTLPGYSDFPLGCSQVVRQWSLMPHIGGSNPSIPNMQEAELKKRRERLLAKWAGRLKSWGRDTDDASHAFCFGEGWDDIVDRLMTRLFEQGWDGDVHQSKEKFGGLRFYIGDYPDIEEEDPIASAEEESFRTCEVCGEPGRRRGGGWIKTLCDVHAAAIGR